MMFFKSTLSITALLALTSAMTLERPVHQEVSILIPIPAEIKAASSFGHHTTSSCDKEDLADCKEFCGLSEQTPTCTADGNKVTCSCKGGKSGDSKCEERCLFCTSDKSALEEAKNIFESVKGRIEEL